MWTRFLCYFLLAGVAFSCSNPPDPKAAAALGIAAADHALDFVAVRLRADDSVGHERVQRVRVALDVAAKFVNAGAPAPEGRAALVEALRLADAALAELAADGVKVPREVTAALAGARALLAE